MTDWREQLREYLDQYESSNFSWVNPDLIQKPIGFAPLSENEIEYLRDFLEDLGFKDVFNDI